MADQTSSPESRRDPRLKATFPVQVLSSQNPHAAHALNVSASGLKLVSDQVLPEQEEIEVHLSLSPELVLSLKAKVVWHREVGSLGMSLAGLAFPQGQRSSELLKGWLETQFAA